jgi:hypothetical protein
MAEASGLAMATMTTTAKKKKRFRPRKLIQKLLRSRGNQSNNDNISSVKNRQDAPLKKSTTLNTTATYKPPSPSTIDAAPRIKTTTAATTSSASTSESSVSPGSPKIVDPGHRDRSSPTKSLSSSRRETVRDVIHAKKESPIKVAPAYSQAVVDWGKFPDSRKDDAPFDEQTALPKDYGAFLFYADSMSNGDVEVDMIYEDLEQRRKKDRKTDRIPTQVSVATPRTPSAARPVDPVPDTVDVVDLSFESEADPGSSLQWVVMSDGTLEMRGKPDEKEKDGIVAPKRGHPSMSQTGGSPRNVVVPPADEGQFVGREGTRVKDADQEVKRIQHAGQEVTRVKDLDQKATRVKDSIEEVKGAKDADQGVKRMKDADQGVKRMKDADQGVKRVKDADQGVKRGKNADREVRETKNLTEPSAQPKKADLLVKERKKIDPPAADQGSAGVRSQDAQTREQDMSERKVVTRSVKETSMDQATVQEEKKEQEEEGNPTVPLVPKILVQKSRTTSPAPTPFNPTSVRRIASLASNIVVAQPKQQLVQIKEDPAPFRSDDFFMAVPEVGDDVTSLDGSYGTVSTRMMTQVLETDEGTEMFSTFSSTYSALQEENETDSDSDVVYGQEPQEEDDSSRCSEVDKGDGDIGSLQKSEPSKLLDPPGVVNSNANKAHEFHRVVSVSTAKTPETSPAKQVSHPISSQEILKQQQVAQIRAAAVDRILKVDGPKGSQPRRIMGRSRESVEAEQQHGSLTPDVPVPPIRGRPALWSPYSYDTDDADDEMGPRSVVSTPGTETDASSFASSSVMRSGYGDDGSFMDDASSYAQARNPRRSGYMSDYTEDEAEDAETTINIGSELTEMATELRVKGPAVLMDWLDLR